MSLHPWVGMGSSMVHTHHSGLALNTSRLELINFNKVVIENHQWRLKKLKYTFMHSKYWLHMLSPHYLTLPQHLISLQQLYFIFGFFFFWYLQVMTEHRKCIHIRRWHHASCGGSVSFHHWESIPLCRSWKFLSGDMGVKKKNVRSDFRPIWKLLRLFSGVKWTGFSPIQTSYPLLPVLLCRNINFLLCTEGEGG